MKRAPATGPVRRAAVALGCAWALAACAAAGGDTPGERADAAASQPPQRATAAAEEAGPRPPLGRAWVIFGTDTVVAEVARTVEEREEGLMYRDEVPDGTGMIFVFERPEMHSFWMQNTYVALDIAYLDTNYVIVDILQMEPLTTDPHPSSGPVMYAVEVRQNWFAEHGIHVGDRAQVEYGLRVGG